MQRNEKNKHPQKKPTKELVDLKHIYHIALHKDQYGIHFLQVELEGHHNGHTPHWPRGKRI